MSADPLAPATPAPGYLAVTGVEIVFVLLGVIVLVAAIACVTSRSVVRAALWLVLSLAALAGCYIVLTAELVAVIQVLIYAGAVVVLLLFGLMFTRAPIGPDPEVDTRNRPVAAVVATAATGVLVALLVDAFRLAYLHLPTGAGTTEAIGAAVFRHYVLPFEVVSLLLLAALIGALVLSRPDVATRERR